jgi:hypothetical protein
MNYWILSLPSAITLAVISLLAFLGRAFIDFYYVFGEFGLSVGMVGATIFIHLVLFGGWIWCLLSAVQGSRRALIAVFGFNLFFLLFIAGGTLASYCPSPCRTAWPLGEITIWISLITGLFSAITLGIQLWQGTQRNTRDHFQAEAP